MTSIKSSLKIASLAAIAIVTAILLSLTVSSSPAHAHADASFKSLKSGTLELSYVPGKSMLNKVSFWGATNQKVTNLKSSKKSVAAATLKYERNVKCYIVTLKLKKAGTTKITCKVNGKKYAVKLKVKKYSPAIKSLKVGSIDATDELSPKRMYRTVGGCYGMTVFASAKNKVSVVAEDGWRLNKIYSVDYVNGKNVTKKYNNGSTVKGSFMIQMKNKKTGLVEDYTVSVVNF